MTSVLRRICDGVVDVFFGVLASRRSSLGSQVGEICGAAPHGEQRRSETMMLFLVASGECLVGDMTAGEAESCRLR